MKNNKKKNKKTGEKDHLPVYGVGPLCVYLMVGVLVLLVVLNYFGRLNSGNVPELKVPFTIVGVVLIVAGVYMWVKTVIIGRIGDFILDNHLCTTGMYSIVRNPIYSAIAMALTGIALLFHNWWFFILPVFCWLDITFLMKATEEKWMLKMYGDEYIEYCKKVNRCIPWFAKK